MLESALAQGLFKIFLAIIGIIAGRIALIWMDRAVQRRIENPLYRSLFKTFMENSKNEAIAMYYSARLIFVAIIIGSAIS
jgi:hypothetical protein